MRNIIKIKKKYYYIYLKKNINKHFWNIKKYNLSTTKNYKQHYKKKLEKSVCIIKSIINIFSNKIQKN